MIPRTAALCLSILLAIALAPAAAAGQEGARASLSIFGTVTDARTGDAIPGMDVVVRTPDGRRAYPSITNDEGRFRVVVDTPGPYIIAMTRLGYGRVVTADVEVLEGRDLYAFLEVEPEAVGLEPIRVTVTGRNPYLAEEGFYERLEAGNGYFLERNEIAAMPTSWPTHVVRGTPGVRIGEGQAWIRRCGPEGTRLLIDGMELDRVTLDDIVAKDQIAAIEIYTTPETVPVDLRRHFTCGVIAVWTTWGESVTFPEGSGRRGGGS